MVLVVGVLLSGCDPALSQAALSATEGIEEGASPSVATVGFDVEPTGCLQASSNGAVEPALSIYSLVFEVDGLESEVLRGESLPIEPGDQVRLIEVTLCIGSYAGNPGEVCVDLAPLTVGGEILSSRHAGTHMAAITTDRITLGGPDYFWTVEENWAGFSLVVNHWTPVMTGDLDCAEGTCEQDDRLTVGFE